MVLTHSLSWGCSQDCWLGLWLTKKAQMGLEDPVPRWLTLMAHESVLTDRGGPSQSVSAKMDLCLRLLVCQDTEAGFPRESQEWARWKLQCLLWPSLSSPPLSFLQGLFGSTSQQGNSSCVGGACTESQEAWIHEGHLGDWPPHLSFNPLFFSPRKWSFKSLL